MPDLPLPKPASTNQGNSTLQTSNFLRSAMAGGVQPAKTVVPPVSVSPSATNPALSDLPDSGLTPAENLTGTPSLPVTPKTSSVSQTMSESADVNEDILPLPRPRTSGFIPTPPPAAVTALSSISNNNPPPSVPEEDSSLPPPSRGPVRASNSLPTETTTNQAFQAPAATPTLGKNPSESSNNQSGPKFAKPAQSILRFLPMVVGGVVLLFLVIFVLGKLGGGGVTQSTQKTGGADTGSQAGGATDSSGGVSGGDQSAGGAGDSANQATNLETITLEYWGLWEAEPNMETVLKEFEKNNPGISVQYVKQSHKDYRERLQTAIDSGNGPDIFRFHAAWVPMMVNDLAPAPSNVYTASQFKESFYPVAATQLQHNGQIIGVPLMYDGLMLYYNTDIFAAAGEKPPTSWAELRVLANKLTLREGGEIKRAGAALGNATNVEHFSDIVALLMLQNGADLNRPNSPEGRDALLFYTNFVTKDKVWNEYMPSSTLAFARGDAAMMLAPSWRAHEVGSINPDLKFATTTLPQLSNTKVAWATYWAEGVNKQSSNKEAAWKLLAYLSSADGQQKFYATQSQTRGFGEPYARADLADSLASHQVLGPLVQDAPSASGWYMSSFTHDNGLNDQVIKYYEDAISGVIGGSAIQTVLETLQTGVLQVLTQYRVSIPL